MPPNVGSVYTYDNAKVGCNVFLKSIVYVNRLHYVNKNLIFDFKVALTLAAVALAPTIFNHLLLTQLLALSENFNKTHP